MRAWPVSWPASQSPVGCAHERYRPPHRAHRLPGDHRPRADGLRRPGPVAAARLRAALRAVGAPAVGDAGHRLHAGPDRLARADRRRGALPAHVRAVVVLHRRAAGGRRARADDAGGAAGGHAASSSARRSPTRRATSRSSTASTPRSACSSRTTSPTGWRRTSQYINKEFGVLFDEMLHSRVDRLARRARGPRDAGRDRDDLPHGHRGHARPHRPALHHGLQRAGGDAAGLRRGLHEGGARRAPPRRVRRALPARHGPARPALHRRDPAHAGRGRPGRRRAS